MGILGISNLDDPYTSLFHNHDFLQPKKGRIKKDISLAKKAAIKRKLYNMKKKL